MLLPEHLRSEEEQYKSIFEDDLTSRMSSQDEQQPMTAMVGYLKSSQDRFVYNTPPISYQQFLKDPIIIVVTPQSTGPQSVNFWLDAVQNYTLFNHLSDAQELIQRLVIENWVSEMRSGYNNYITLSNNIQRERWVMLAWEVLGIATSILLFNTMNRLYFEEFRCAIFIERIAGLRFLEIHRTYLFQNFSVIENQTIEENLKLGLVGQKLSRSEQRLKQKQALEQVGLSYLDLDKRIFELSGGESQRVALAKVILKNPPFILADEPTASIDPATSQLIMEILLSLRDDNRLIIIATHNPTIWEMADEVVTMDSLK